MSKAFLFNFALAKKSFLQLTALYLIVGVFVGAGMQNANVAIGITSVVGPFFTLYTLFSYDSKSAWDRYCGALPFGRREYVAGRCLCVVLCTVASAVVAALLGIAFEALVPLMPFASTFAVPASASSAVCIAVMASAVILFSSACSLPFLFKFGLSRAIRFVPAAMLILVMVLTVGVPALIEFLAPSFNWDYLLENYVAFTVAVALACVALFAASGALSVRLFAQREL